MFYKHLSFLIIALISFCIPAKAQPGIDSTFSILPQSEIVIDDFGISQVKEGDRLVFEYKIHSEGIPEIIDDEFTERLVWEVPADDKSFCLKDNKFSKQQAFFYMGCFCAERGYYEISSGCLQGKRMDKNRWNVHGTVTFTTSSGNDKTVQIDQVFKVNTQQ